MSTIFRLQGSTDFYITKKTLSLSGLESGEGNAREADATEVRVNGVAIYGPNFTLDFGAIDMAAGLIGMPQDRARKIAEICARDWAANGMKPQHPMAMVKAAIMGDHNKGQVQEGRLAHAKGSQPTKTFRR